MAASHVVNDKLQMIHDVDIADAHATFIANRTNIVAKNAVTAHGIRAVARVPESVAQNTTVFDIEIKQGERCNQMHSGRCWVFASLNTMRCRVIKRLNLETFEFSQAYPLFWDKIEKSNWFLENIIETLDEPLDGRLITWLLAEPVADGGQWDMFCALVKKYGVVPKEAMPETANSRNTCELNRYLTRYLRGAAKRLRTLYEKDKDLNALRALKKEMMSEVYRICAICLGEPPRTFDIRLRDKEDKLVLQENFTPQQFFEEVIQLELDNFVSVISANTADKPFGHVYTVERLGNVVEAQGVRYLNLEIEELKRLAIAQLTDGHPVWFGCDVSQSYLRNEGIMDPASLDVDGLFGISVEGCLTREERLMYGESLMTHAMVFEGVNLDAKGEATLWKVENSWGKNHGKNGFDSITDAWFDEYVYQIVVDRTYLTDAQRTIYDTEQAIPLKPWDPMGSLAQ